MKKLKKYKVICKLDSYAVFNCKAESKTEADQLANDADRKGELFFGDQEMSIVEITEVKK